MITYLNGDATEPVGKGPKIICHICNDVGKWGAGFVLALSKKWKMPEESYREWYRDAKDGFFHLGLTQFCNVETGVYVANMVAQRGVSSDDDFPMIRYDALDACLLSVCRMAKVIDASVHMPRIGCGLAGGDWESVEFIIHKTLDFYNIPVYVYDFE